MNLKGARRSQDFPDSTHLATKPGTNRRRANPHSGMRIGEAKNPGPPKEPNGRKRAGGLPSEQPAHVRNKVSGAGNRSTPTAETDEGAHQGGAASSTAVALGSGGCTGGNPGPSSEGFTTIDHNGLMRSKAAQPDPIAGGREAREPQGVPSQGVAGSWGHFVDVNQ